VLGFVLYWTDSQDPKFGVRIFAQGLILDPKFLNKLLDSRPYILAKL